MKPCTQTLVAQAKKGDAHAFATLYEEIYKDLYANECKKQFRLQSKVIPYDMAEDFSSDLYSVDLSEHLALKQAFSALSEQERLIVGLSLFAGYNSREIARYVHKKESTIRSSKKRALEKMKQFLDDTQP